MVAFAPGGRAGRKYGKSSVLQAVRQLPVYKNIPMRNFLFLTVFISAVAYSQPCDCRADYQWLKKIIEENDAGFRAVLDEKGAGLYRFHNASVEKKVKAAKDLMTCHALLKSWLSFFRKEHLYLFPVAASGQLHFPQREIHVETFKKTWKKKNIY